ncbi:PLP-dependent aminotransferase family protein [Gryllotalpicola protaetiae]|uniref:PLP-dependent aminotransferase family protein n=1 Tax=Gryllotalpicola protaetiae TaxID=2419771 RepID=A0A387BNC0_9MICO|nr:PLP-dependent aminotransferase family protein [Gryllotalpicola protaetiae]AYG03524.1 PLP-dependent aminotransferase family protein [Gryllotalpicola protaetiae]
MTAPALAGLDVHLELSRTRPAQSLEAALRGAVTDGRLAPGTRLPAARSLARDLAISRNTVAEVYARLAAEGWLASRVGAGTWVAERTAGAGVARQAPLVPPSRAPIELRGGIPDGSAFPRREWLAALRRVTAGPALLGYPDPSGVRELRAALAGYTARTRGVVASAETIAVGTGFGELLRFICSALRGRGATRVAVEQFGHERHRAIIAAAGLRPVPLPVDDQGAVLDELADCAAVLLTPAHQFPTGVPLSPERRRAVVEWAHRADALVIEDDYDGEFRYDRRSIGALQALAPDRVAYLGTASKAVSPSVGLAWAVVPHWLHVEMREQRELSGGRPAALQQHALAEFIAAHDYDHSVRRLRAEYRARRIRLENLVEAQLSGCSIEGLLAGLQVLVRLPAGTDEQEIAAVALERGVLVDGLDSYRAPGSPPVAPGLVVGFAAPSPAQFDRALVQLAASVRAVLD